jgi:hypothetical protein
MLGTAAHHPRVLQGPTDGLIRDANTGWFGEVIDQTLARPAGDGEPQTPGPPAHGSEQRGPLGLGHLGGAARAWRILQACYTLGQRALQPA